MKHQIQLQVPAGAVPLAAGVVYVVGTTIAVMCVASERWAAALAAMVLMIAIGPIFAYSYGRWLDHTDVQGARAASEQRRGRPHWSDDDESAAGPDDNELDDEADEPADEADDKPAAAPSRPRPAWAGPRRA